MTHKNFCSSKRRKIARAARPLDALEPRLLLSQTTFAAYALKPTDDSPLAIVAGDFNNDHKIDLASANSVGTSVSVLLGNGDGTYAARIDTNIPGQATALAAADFNNDGFLDLAVSDASTNYLRILRGDGAGNFVQSNYYWIGLEPRSVVAADLNGDLLPDVAVANRVSGNVSILLNTGTAFAPKTDFTTGPGPYTLALADFNRDGNPDLATANSNGTSVTVLLNNGSANFAGTADYFTGPNPRSLAVADFNFDGFPDIATANAGDNTVSVLLNNAAAQFPSATAYAVGQTPVSIAAADFNGDGNVDLANINQIDDNVSILEGTGSGAFNAPLNFAVGAHARYVLAADLNADAKPDLAVADNTLNSLAVLLNQAAWAAPTVTAVYARGIAWTAPFLNNLAVTHTGHASFGYRIPTGSSAQLNALNWGNIDQLSLTFSHNVATSQEALAVAGINVANYTITDFAYDSAAHTATWTLSQKLDTDRLTLTLPASSTLDAANQDLDGEWTDALSTASGNGAPGGDFTFHLNILPADMNGDGIVDGADFDTWVTHLQSSTFLTTLGNVNADSLVDGADFDLWFTHLQSTLPSSLNLNLNPNLTASLTNSQLTDSAVQPLSSDMDDSLSTNSRIQNPPRRLYPETLLSLSDLHNGLSPRPDSSARSACKLFEDWHHRRRCHTIDTALPAEIVLTIKSEYLY